jgi:PAS domain S-box-containing protein
MINFTQLSLTEWIGLFTFIIVTLGGSIMALLNFVRSKKTVKIDDTTKMLNSAMEMVDRFDKLVEQVKFLETENSSLKSKVQMLEKALLESPLYRTFFEMTKFDCLILYAETGKIFDSNNSFREHYGYTEKELTSMSVYDLTMQPEETKISIETGLEHVPSRLHRTKNGQAFLVEVFAVYHVMNDVKYIFCIYVPKVQANIASRVQDMLTQIIDKFNTDYATVWVLHNGGSNKLSGLYEAVRTGNSYLFQDYRRLPATIFGDLFVELKEKKVVVVNEKDSRFEPTRLIMKHANLSAIVFVAVMDKDNNKLIGMLTTSWRNREPNLCESDISILTKYAESDLLRQVVGSEVHLIQV